jgi:hypothetical protein
MRSAEAEAMAVYEKEMAIEEERKKAERTAYKRELERQRRMEEIKRQ